MWVLCEMRFRKFNRTRAWEAHTHTRTRVKHGHRPGIWDLLGLPSESACPAPSFSVGPGYRPHGSEAWQEGRPRKTESS